MRRGGNDMDKSHFTYVTEQAYNDFVIGVRVGRNEGAQPQRAIG
jgi:hypothetical protein